MSLQGLVSLDGIRSKSFLSLFVIYIKHFALSYPSEVDEYLVFKKKKKITLSTDDINQI